MNRYAAFLTMGILWLTNPSAVNAQQYRTCESMRMESLMVAAQGADTLTSLIAFSGVIAGGARNLLTIAHTVAEGQVVCGGLGLDSTAQRITATRVPEGDSTRLKFDAPATNLGPASADTLVVVVFALTGGYLDMDSPPLAIKQAVKISDRMFSLWIAIAIAVLAYIAAVADSEVTIHARANQQGSARSKKGHVAITVRLRPDIFRDVLPIVLTAQIDLGSVRPAQSLQAPAVAVHVLGVGPSHVRAASHRPLDRPLGGYPDPPRHHCGRRWRLQVRGCQSPALVV